MKMFDDLCCLKETLGAEDFCGVVYTYETYLTDLLFQIC